MRAHTELGEQLEVDVVLGPGSQILLADLRSQLRLSRREHLPDDMRHLRVGRVSLPELSGQGLLRMFHMRHGRLPDGSPDFEQINHAPIGEVGNGEPGSVLQHDVGVEGGRERLAGPCQEDDPAPSGFRLPPGFLL